MRGLVFQAAGVAKPLASMKRMVDAGHMVIFDSEGSYVYHKAAGEINQLGEE